MRILFTLACLVFCVGAFAAEAPLACRTSLVPLKYRQPAEDLATGKLPIPDYQDTVIACRNTSSLGMPGTTGTRGSIPASAWLDAEHSRYSAALVKQPVNILVVPFQDQGYGLDRIERAVMTADLAYAIGDAGSLRVADPFLTALALGEGERRIDPSAVTHLAQKIGAQRILFGYVGHDLQHAFTLTLVLKETSASSASSVWQSDWRSVHFTNAKTPAYVLHEMLPEVLVKLPLQLTPKPARAVPVSATQTRIDAPPSDLVSASRNSGADIATLSLLAALVPADSERPRERLFERALLTAMRSNAPRPGLRFFEAYALFNLHRRPAALARIEGISGSSFDALRALLDGNLPVAQSATQAVKNSLVQLLLQFLVRDLEYDYRIKKPTVPTAVETLFTEAALRSWMPLLGTRMEDRNKLFAAQPRQVKQAFDQAFPLDGLGLEAITLGSSVARGQEPDEIEIDLANARHGRRVTATLNVPRCCHTRDLQPGRWDLLWLLEGAAEDRITRSLRTMISVQGASSDALEAIARYEPLFKGHPLITALGAGAAQQVAAQSADDTSTNWTERSDQDGRASIRWSPGQNRVAFAAALSLGIPSPDSGIWLDIYGYDFPRRPDWPFEFLGSQDAAAEAQRLAFASEAHEFSTNDVSPLSQIRGPARKAALAALGSRFAGHPARPTTEPAPAIPASSQDRIAAARAAAQGDPNKYYALGYYTFYSEHPLKESLDAFLAYPPFRAGSARDPLELANKAFDTGSRFFWLGEGELAKPLFQIAADLDTGSDSSLASQQRLLLLAGDYRGAAEKAQQRAIQYSSAYAQRDYLSLLHALGEHDAAWSAFSQLRLAQSDAALWTSAVVGHRMQRLDERAIRRWLKTPEIRDAKVKAQRFASYYAVIWNSTDRVPPADLGAFVEELEGERVAVMDSNGVLRPHSQDPTAMEFVKPTFRPKGAAAAAPFPEGTRLKSERAYFADAYSAVARGEYAEAVNRFAAMAQLYPIDGGPLPYLAYAAGKTGDMLNVEAYVMTPRPNEYENFDMLLSRTFFAASRKQVDEAYRLLGLAFRAKPYGGERPVSVDYQFAQACEWLYRDTKDRRFVATLLAWAKAYQSVQPVIAWAYAVQYQYEEDPQARMRSLAMTQYLDPLSERIRKASKQDTLQAQAWLAVNNPFRVKQKPPDSEMTTSAHQQLRQRHAPGIGHPKKRSFDRWSIWTAL